MAEKAHRKQPTDKMSNGYAPPKQSPENQAGRRNLTDDQHSVIADSIRERRSSIAMRERAVKARLTGGDATPEQKADRLEVNVSSKRSEPPKERTRAAVAREFRIPERKLRNVQTVKKANPEGSNQHVKKEVLEVNVSSKSKHPKESKPGQLVRNLTSCYVTTRTRARGQPGQANLPLLKQHVTTRTRARGQPRKPCFAEIC